MVDQKTRRQQEAERMVGRVRRGLREARNLAALTDETPYAWSEGDPVLVRRSATSDVFEVGSHQVAVPFMVRDNGDVADMEGFQRDPDELAGELADRLAARHTPRPDGPDVTIQDVSTGETAVSVVRYGTDLNEHTYRIITHDGDGQPKNGFYTADPARALTYAGLSNPVDFEAKANDVRLKADGYDTNPVVSVRLSEPENQYVAAMQGGPGG